MARKKPALNFTGSLEVEIQAPLDARTVVPTKADLTLASNFPYAYEGLVVYVEEEKRHYTLIGSDTTVLANWQEGGGSGDKTFEFNQSTPASEWRIFHSLKKYPVVTVVDSGGSVVVGDIKYVDDSNIIITFQAAFAGKAYLN